MKISFIIDKKNLDQFNTIVQMLQHSQKYLFECVSFDSFSEFVVWSEYTDSQVLVWPQLGIIPWLNSAVTQWASVRFKQFNLVDTVSHVAMPYTLPIINQEFNSELELVSYYEKEFDQLLTN